MYDVLIVGAGLSGAVIAERITTQLNKRVLIIDKRNHIGGNCYDYIEEETQLRLSKYGPHFFHTNDEEVFKYINNFGEWIRYDLCVVSDINNRYVPVPVNMNTINILCEQNLQTEDEVKDWFKKEQIEFNNPKNSEEVALSRVGAMLYNKMFKSYTKKQWNCEPKDLDSSVLSRIPIRYNNDPRYFSDKYQCIPKYGYTEIFNKMLSHPNITIQLNTEFEENKFHYKTLIFTGPIDLYFKNSGLPKLNYRSLKFKIEKYKSVGFIQPHLIINNPSENILHTRSVEYKHIPFQKETPHTIVIYEYPSDIGEPYYPIPTVENHKIYEMYRQLALKEEEKGIYFIGRLANYKYFNMDQAIRNALDQFEILKSKI